MKNYFTKIPAIFFIFLVVLHIYLPRALVRKAYSLIFPTASANEEFKSNTLTVSKRLEALKEIKKGSPLTEKSFLLEVKGYLINRKFVPTIHIFGEEGDQLIVHMYARQKFALNSALYNTIFPSYPFMPLEKHEGSFTLIERGRNSQMLRVPFPAASNIEKKINAQIKFYNDLVSDLPNQNIFIYNIVGQEFSSFYQQMIPDSHYQYSGKALLDRFQQRLDPAISYGEFNYTAEQLPKFFFKTDHHWAIEGAWEAYRQIVKLINAKTGLSFQAKEPQKCFEVEGIEFHGSYAKTAGFTQLFDRIIDCKTDLPNYTLHFNDQFELPRNDREIQRFSTDDIFKNYYAYYFGNDYGFLHYKSSINERKILLLVDSYSNSMEHLFTAHYGDVYVVDLRHYEKDMGGFFDLKAFVNNRGIDDVLFILSTSWVIFGYDDVVSMQAKEK